MTTDNFCFYLQNGLIQTSQTGGQWYTDTSPFGIPWTIPLNFEGPAKLPLVGSFPYFYKRKSIIHNIKDLVSTL